MNKYIIITLFILLVVGLGYYSYSHKENSVLTDGSTPSIIRRKAGSYFVQNQDCLKYKSSISNQLEIKNSPFGKASLEQIFYSPKVNSCVYVEYTEKGGFYNKRLLDIRDDGYSSDPLMMCTAIRGPEEEIENAYQEMDGNLNRYHKDLVGCDKFEGELTQYQ